MNPVIENKPKWKRYLANVILLFVILAVFVEGAGRLMLSVESFRRRAFSFDDSSYRLQWTARHSSRAEWVTGVFSTYNSIRGWVVRPDIRNMRVGDMLLNTNSRGLRGSAEYPYQRIPGKLRIVTLGDSFTFGLEVNDAETFSSQLEMLLPNTEVLNLGVAGYGHDQMLLYLRSEGVKYRPDVVIVGFVYIDVSRNILRFFAYAKPEFKLVSGHLALTNVPVPAPDRVLAAEPYRLKSLDLLCILQDKLRWLLGKNERDARDLTNALLHEIIATSRSIGATPLFVYLPVYEEIDSHSKGQPYPVVVKRTPFADRDRYLGGICQQEHIPCLFLRRRFEEEVKRGADFHPQGHWNAAAHNLATQEIRNFLIARGLIQNHPGGNLPTGAGSESRASR